MNIQVSSGLDFIKFFEVVFIPFGTIYLKQFIVKINTVLAIKANCDECRKSFHTKSESIDQSMHENREDHEKMWEKININAVDIAKLNGKG
jgi:hypothetical protein